MHSILPGDNHHLPFLNIIPHQRQMITLLGPVRTPLPTSPGGDLNRSASSSITLTRRPQLVVAYASTVILRCGTMNNCPTPTLLPRSSPPARSSPRSRTPKQTGSTHHPSTPTSRRQIGACACQRSKTPDSGSTAECHRVRITARLVRTTRQSERKSKGSSISKRMWMRKRRKKRATATPTRPSVSTPTDQSAYWETTGESRAERRLCARPVPRREEPRFTQTMWWMTRKGGRAVCISGKISSRAISPCRAVFACGSGGSS